MRSGALRDLSTHREPEACPTLICFRYIRLLGPRVLVSVSESSRYPGPLLSRLASLPRSPLRSPSGVSFSLVDCWSFPRYPLFGHHFGLDFFWPASWWILLRKVSSPVDRIHCSYLLSLLFPLIRKVLLGVDPDFTPPSARLGF